MAYEERLVADNLRDHDVLALCRPRLVELGVLTSVLLAVVIALQHLAGAFAAEFGDDEASHYISSLLIHDYLVSGTFLSPFAYLKLFHSHYPLVGIGHWPPLYYFVEAAWMLFVSTGRSSVLLFSALITTVTAVACYAFVARRLGRLSGLFVAFAFVASPIVQEGSSELMLDIPVALLCLLAMFAYVRYLDTGRAQFSVTFGIVAAMALMVKGTAGCLALLPVFAVLIAQRFDLLRKGSFWVPVPIVGAIAGPWYILTYKLTEAGFRFAWGWHYFLNATAANAAFLLASVGALVLAASAIGFFSVIASPRVRSADTGFVGAAALFAAIWTFQSIVPAAIQGRYLAPALPPLLILAASGIWVLCRSPMRIGVGWPLRTAQTRTVLGTLILSLSFLLVALPVAKKPHLGFIAAAREIWAHRIEGNPSVLLVTNAAGEAAAIAELSMADPRRPSLFAIRGSRLLGGGGYNNQDYAPRFQTPAEVSAAIDQYAIPLVLFRADSDAAAWMHLKQIEEARKLNPDRWELIYRDARVSPEILLFRLRDNEVRKADVGKLIELSGPRALAQ